MLRIAGSCANSLKDLALPTKDGNRRQPRTPWKLRAAIAALSFVTGVAVSLIARHAVSTPVRRRKRCIPTGTADTGTRLQQLTRFRAPNGSHSIHATLLAEFEPGERCTTLHAAFCPPFERLPTVDAEPVDDSDATVNVSQLLHNGIQLEVRLPQPADEKQSVTIALVASDATE